MSRAPPDPATARNRSLASLIFSAVSIFVGLFFVFIYVYFSVELLDPLAEEIFSNFDLAGYNGEEIINDMFGTVTSTVPLLGGGGLIAIGVVNEYRRRRTAARQRIR